MKCTHAIWEKRNMGIDAMEYDIAIDDRDEIIPEILRTKLQYNVCRVPASNVTALASLQENGFAFEECMISIAMEAEKFKSIYLPRPQMRLINTLTYSEMTSNDFDMLFSELRNGIFSNDRISKDPHLGRKLAAERFIGWTNDELDRGGRVFNIVYKSQNIGFFVNRHRDDGDCVGVLFGMFNDWKKSGLGIGGVYISLKQAFDNNAKRFLGGVSTNNTDQLRLDMSLGFSITEIKYILTNHNMDI